MRDSSNYINWFFECIDFLIQCFPLVFPVCSHFMTFKNLRLDLKRSRWMMSGRRPIAIPPECVQRCSAHCRLMLHNPESTCINILYFLLSLTRSQKCAWKTKGGCGQRASLMINWRPRSLSPPPHCSTAALQALLQTACRWRQERLQSACSSPT